MQFNLDEEEEPDPTAEQLAAVGDLGPEGLLFISANNSPIEKPLVVAANEVSGTTTIFSVESAAAESVPEPGSVFGLLVGGALGWKGLKRKR